MSSPVRPDNYLTAKANAQWPDAIVIRIEIIDDPPQFFLKRPGQPDLHLGASFAEARRALQAALEEAQGGGAARPGHAGDAGKKPGG